MSSFGVAFFIYEKRREMRKNLLALAVLLTIGGGVAVWSAEQNNQPAQTQVVQTETKKSEVSYQGVEDRTALSLLKDKHKVQTEDYPGVGEMVTSIDGVKPTDKQFWAFYVNGKTAQVGADTYVTEPSDTITWKLETIQ